MPDSGLCDRAALRGKGARVVWLTAGYGVRINGVLSRGDGQLQPERAHDFQDGGEFRPAFGR